VSILKDPSPELTALQGTGIAQVRSLAPTFVFRERGSDCSHQGALPQIGQRLRWIRRIDLAGETVAVE
jgi:hypothetical protein